MWVNLKTLTTIYRNAAKWRGGRVAPSGVKPSSETGKENKVILRLVIAFTRWVWGVSPAFVTADSGGWYAVMFFGVLIDIVVAVALAAALIDYLPFKQSK